MILLRKRKLHPAGATYVLSHLPSLPSANMIIALICLLISLPTKASGNPFTVVELAAHFRQVGHGETYKHPESIIWWARGGQLHGKSPARIAFLSKILEEGPIDAWEPIDKWQDHRTAGKKGEYYFVYFGKETPTEWTLNLPCDQFLQPMLLTGEIIDTWDMTIEPLEGVFEFVPDGKYVFKCTNQASISLPGKPYMAVRMKRAPK